MSRGLAGPAPVGLLLGVLAGALLGSGVASAAVPFTNVCGAVPLHHARCFSKLVSGSRQPFDGLAPSGYGAPDIQSAYKLPSSTGGAGETVASGDGLGGATRRPSDPAPAGRDLGQYRSFYGLPACTTANGCFRKVNQTGGSLPPAPSPDWALEISLDLDMVSPVCPKRHILLVEANTNLDSDLYAAEDTAARLGANAISNSW